MVLLALSAACSVHAEAQSTTTGTAQPIANTDEKIEREGFKCQTGMPISPLLVGVIAPQIACQSHFSWELRGGVLMVSFKTPQPYLRAALGVTFPLSKPWGVEENDPQWQVLQRLRYVFLAEQSFAESLSTTERNPMLSPSLQQWSTFLDSEVSLEFLHSLTGNGSTKKRWGIKIWQTLPPQWRTLGTLRNTRNSEASGYQILAQYGSRSWTAQFGLGRMNIAIDRIAANFLHPTFEITALLGEPW